MCNDNILWLDIVKVCCRSQLRSGILVHSWQFCCWLFEPIVIRLLISILYMQLRMPYSWLQAQYWKG